MTSVETRPVTLDLTVEEIRVLWARASYLANPASRHLQDQIVPVVDEDADDTAWRFR